MENKKIFKYCMIIRPFGLGCQPMDGFEKTYLSADDRYWSIVEYSRKLTSDECQQYAMQYLS